MKKVFLGLLTLSLVLCASCAPVSVPPTSSSPSSSSSDPTSGSNLTRYPQDGQDAFAQYGPQAEQIPAITENSAVTYLRAHGAKGDGVTDDAAALQAAMQAVGQNGFIIIEQGNYRLARSLTVSADTVLLFAPDAVLSPDAGTQLLVNGYVQANIAPIFGGEGDVCGTVRNVGYPQWFGELGTDDDTAVLQKAVNTLQVMHLPADKSYALFNLVISRPIRIEGEGSRKTVIKKAAHDGVMFDLRSGDVCIRDLQLDGTHDGTLFYFNTAVTDIRRVTLYNIWARTMDHCIRDAQSGGAHTVCDVNIIDVRADSAHAEGYYFTDFRTGIRLDGVQTQNLGVSYEVTKPGMLFCGVTDLYAADIDITGGRPQNTKAHGLVLRDCSNVTLNRSMMEYTNGHALWLDNCTNVLVEQYVLCGFNDAALRLSGCRNVTFDLLLSVGTYFPDGDPETFPLYYPETAHGAYLTDCSDITFHSLNLERISGKGMLLQNCSNVHLQGLISDFVRDDVITELDGCRNNRFSGLSLKGYQARALVLCGEGSTAVGVALGSTEFYDIVTAPFEK